MMLLLLLPITLFAATRDINGNVTADAATANEKLFDSTVEVEPTFQQNESFTVQGNVMYGCVDTTLNGRQDDICVTNSKAPECVGLKKTLENATNCLEYFVPATLGCKTYGTAEHSPEDWVAFGNNYYNTLSQCAVTKSENDEKREKLVSLTDMVVYDPTNPNGLGGPGIASGLNKASVNSTVSQNSTEQLSLQNIDDGASRLGYQTGDIIKSALRKEPFLNVVLDSPFVNDLNVVNRSKFESGIQNADSIVARVKESRNFTADADSNTDTQPTVTTEITTASTPAAQQAATPTAENSRSPTFAADSFEKKVEIAPIKVNVNSEGPKRPLLADRIAEIERAALEQRKKRALASEENQKVEAPQTQNADLGSEETSLFQRIRIAYQRQQNGLQAKSKNSAAQILGLD